MAVFIRMPIFVALLSTLLPLSHAAETLIPDQSINDTGSLISAEGRFKLGFFSPGRSKFRYLGIWYNRIKVQTVIWVANRQTPVPDTSGMLTMNANGSLVLTDVTTATVYWSVAATQAPASPVARLLDNGNFVILNSDSAGGGNTGNYLWQSFDYPTDTLLPGMKIGSDFRTGLNRKLTGWRTGYDPAPGDYTVQMNRELLLLNRSEVHWRSGPWVGERFSGIPEMKANNVFNYGFFSNEEGIYYRFDVWNSSSLTRVTVEPSGSFIHFLWVEEEGSWENLWTGPKDKCDEFNTCGTSGVCYAEESPKCSCVEGFKPRWPEEWARGVAAGGCVRESAVDCQNGTHRFVTLAGAKLPDTAGSTVNMSVGLEECREMCLTNCSCRAFTSGDGSGCIVWFGELMDIRVYENGGQGLYVRLATADPGSQKGPRKKIVITIIVVLIVTLSVAVIVVWVCLRRRGTTRKRSKAMPSFNEQNQYDESTSRNDLEMPIFNLSTITCATENFSLHNILGQGGFGPVYKGKLHDGQAIAVKRLSRSSGQGSEEFRSEIQLVAKLQHTNLVRLLGCCIDEEEKILVYEYMPNQSLDKFIFDPTRGRQLDWAKRFQIIEGIAQGLLYLHKYSRLRVIHRDLKASNILLDDDWNPKISDFGMARIFTWNENQANTNRIVGTYGYMAPEYAMKGLFSVKSDVFSFGVLMLEILSGKKNTSIQHFGPSLNLPGYAWKLWRDGKELGVMDPTLHNVCPNHVFSKCVHVALLCVQENPLDRPIMVDVVSMLSNDATGLPTPNKPAFFFGRHSSSEDLHASTEGLSYSNDLTFSGVDGR